MESNSGYHSPLGAKKSSMRDDRALFSFHGATVSFVRDGRIQARERVSHGDVKNRTRWNAAVMPTSENAELKLSPRR